MPDTLLTSVSGLALCAGFMYPTAGVLAGSSQQYIIPQSIRFNDDDLAYMYRTPSVAGNRKTWTWSSWVKKSGSGNLLFAAYSDGSNRMEIQSRNGGDFIGVFDYVAAAFVGYIKTSALYRDFSAWYHIVVVWDSTNATAGDRMRLYVNGVEVTAFGTDTNPSLNHEGWVNSANIPHYIGCNNTGSGPANFYDGLLSNINFIDGAALTASDFGKFDSNGVWVPKVFDSAAVTTVDQIPRTTYNALIGDMTILGALDEAFDGLLGTTFSCAQLATAGYIGKDWGNGNAKDIVAYAVFAPTGSTFSGNTGGTHNLYLYGSNSAPASYSNGTLLDTQIGVSTSIDAIVVVNTTDASGSYRYHWIAIVNTAAEVWIAEIEFFEASTGYGTNGFHIDGTDANDLGNDVSSNSTVASYGHGQSTGGRTATITATSDLTINLGTTNNLIDGLITGVTADAVAYAAQTTAGKYVRFDFGVARIVTEARITIDRADQPTHTQKWQGSDDAAAWTDIGSSFTLNGNLVETVDLSSNVTAYRYYQMLGVSGSWSAAVYNEEVEFKINGNTFATSGLTNADQMLDTPTDDITRTGASNHCVMSPINTYLATLSNANLDVYFSTYTSSSRGTIGIPVGRSSDLFVFECVMTAGTIAYGEIGVVDAGTPFITSDWRSYKNGSSWGGAGLCDGLNPTYTYNIQAKVASGFTYALNDVVGVEVDCVTGDVKYYKNGVYQFTNSALAGIAALTTDRDWFPACCMEGPSTGNWSFTFIEADMTYFANYAVGAKTLSTANLPAPTVADPSTEFGLVTDIETNIIATLGAATEATNYVRIYKNRSNIEGWYWQFSHDSGNAYTVSATASRAAFPTLSGIDSFLGAEFNCDTHAKTGSKVHTNGVASTCTHNVGHTNYSVLLFPRLGGEVLWYHPQFTAGDLAYLTGDQAPFASTLVTNIQANSFDIGSSHATDAYDYLVIPETSGLYSLPKWTGNANADGTFVATPSLSPNFVFTCNASSGVENIMFHDAEGDGNPVHKRMYMDYTNAESVLTTYEGDFDSNGIKWRATLNPNTAIENYGVICSRGAFGGLGVAQGKAR